MAVILPIALIEGAVGPTFYECLYGPRPFNFDGAERYVGFRPLGFFEHGNQYGIWVAATALAAVWLWKTSVEPRWRGRFLAVAVLSLATALASQSVGAIVLLCAGLALSLTIGRSLTRWAFALFLLLIVLAGAVYLSGKVPLRVLAEETPLGRHVVEAMRSSGRGSFIWRIARDQTALPLISTHPLVGTARWDWWRGSNERPWGLAFLILGQFGLIGFIFAFGAILMPALRALATPRLAGGFMDSATPLAVIVLMASADALLNSFLFYPAILMAGSLAPAKKAALANSA